MQQYCHISSTLFYFFFHFVNNLTHSQGLITVSQFTLQTSGLQPHSLIPRFSNNTYFSCHVLKGKQGKLNGSQNVRPYC